MRDAAQVEGEIGRILTAPFSEVLHAFEALA